VIFSDRRDAGRRLAEALAHLAEERAVVLAIPRGGVEVGAEVAKVHGWPLDIVIPRKVRAPSNPELGLGAIAPGVRVLDESMLRALAVSDEYLEREIAEQEEEIRRRQEAYRRGRPAEDLEGKVAIVVDDGVATGGTAAAALRWARAQGAARVVLGIPVGPREGLRRLEADADEVVALETPEPFFAVGQWYGDFPQTSDDEVVSLLEASRW
jgi:putative phosphoribosyl transferase